MAYYPPHLQFHPEMGGNVLNNINKNQQNAKQLPSHPPLTNRSPFPDSWHSFTPVNIKKPAKTTKNPVALRIGTMSVGRDVAGKKCADFAHVSTAATPKHLSEVLSEVSARLDDGKGWYRHRHKHFLAPQCRNQFNSITTDVYT